MTTSRRAWATLIVLALPLLASCGTVSRRGPVVGPATPSGAWRLVTVAPTTATRPLANLEDPGRILVVTDGPVCGESLGMPDRTVALAGSFIIPDYADQATVFLNGWSLRYLQSDEDVKEIGAVITDIALQGKELTWRAAGTIADEDRDDHYEFCYVYTVLAWKSGAVDVVADDRDIPAGSRFYNGVSVDGPTALATASSYRRLPAVRPPLSSAEMVAILPRGFRFDYEDEHHVLQLALNIDHNDLFVEAGKVYGRLVAPLAPGEASRIDPSITTWDTTGILKDNSVSRKYVFEQQSSTLGGTGVSVVRPAFSVAPGRNPGLFGACLGPAGPGGIKREQVEIRDVPFDYAVPVLSGWELDYGCDDEHVTQIGIWLENVGYQKDPGSTTGVLRYTVASVLRDKNFSPAHGARHKVDILGIRAAGPSEPRPPRGQ